MRRRKRKLPATDEGLPVYWRVSTELDEAFMGGDISPGARRYLEAAAAATADQWRLAPSCPRKACRRAGWCQPRLDGRAIDAMCPAVVRGGRGPVFEACVFAMFAALRLLQTEPKR